MDSFSLLKYWRTTATSSSTATSSVAALPPEADSSSSSSSSASDDGPFFDLEFAVPEEEEEDEDDDDLEEDFNFSLPVDHLPLSPSDDLFFRGRLVPLDPNPDEKHHHHQHLQSLKSKLLVFALGLKKYHHHPKPIDPTTSPAPAHKPKPGKFFAIKLEEVPIMSRFTRDKPQRQSVDEEDLSRRFSRETLQKYLRKIKPLHVKVSRRNHHQPPKEAELGGVARKHIGKCRSASSAVAAAPSPPPVVARRRDDSLLQQQDGIQSAIAHCKRSFNGNRETPDSTQQRSTTDSCDERTCTEKRMEDRVGDNGRD